MDLHRRQQLTPERFNGTTGLLSTARDLDGNVLTFSHVGSLLSSVTTADHTGAQNNATFYDYDTTAGRTSNITQVRTLTWNGAANVTQTRTRYTYDASNRLSTVTTDLTPTDNTVTDAKVYRSTYSYDGTSQRIASLTQDDGTAVSFAYTLVGTAYCVPASPKPSVARAAVSSTASPALPTTRPPGPPL